MGDAMLDTPRMRSAVVYFIIAALFGTLAWRGDRLPDWFRLFCSGVALIAASAGIVETVNYLTYAATNRIRDFEEARNYAAIMLANSLKGLTAQQTDIVARYGAVTAVGIIGQNEVNWLVRAPGGDLPLGFVQDFLELSAKTSPFLWPVRKHEELNDWPNSEQLCTIMTDLCLHRDWAERSGGPYPARLLVPLKEVADKLGLEM